MQHYGAVSTVYNFGHVSGFGSPAQVAAGIFGYGAYGQVETISAWGTRITMATSAITKAGAYAKPAASGLLSAALAEVLTAKSVYDTATKNKEWKPDQELAVAQSLQKARGYFDQAQAMNLTSGGSAFPTAFPTWALAAQALPQGAPGTMSPGVLAPATPAPGTAPGVPPVVAPAGPRIAGMGIGTIALLAVGGLLLLKWRR